MNNNKKVALVTGASSGFGLHLVQALLSRGVVVYAAARRLEPMSPLQQAGAILLSMDVCDDASVQAGVEQIVRETGQLDLVYNNAGYGAFGPVESVSLDEARYQFEVNVFGLARVNAAVLPILRRQRSGRIIVTASNSSYIVAPGTGWYGATKYAVRALCEALRLEVSNLGIQVVQIEPGPVNTGFGTVAFEKLDKLDVSDDYRPLIGAFRTYMADSYAKSPGMESTVNAMVHAGLARRPRWIYRTTFESKSVTFLRGLLGIHIYSWIVLRIFSRNQRQQ
ncbi:SDR family NAD(P)-dependent oxidoreductase [Saccharospirillum mangrovi]|uniref:SDR family NAD(P)-dependent oxidoreductase n=1 Tax=Saccharospirillum mangrovi TaxID=2161747 RepID=UPI00130060E6|nr:SDR family NAD(P)-dependent oxidoreductase [Saccharospirillum mangrovi]